MKPFILWLSVAFGLALLIPILWATNWQEALATLQQSNPEYLIVFLACTAIVFALAVYRWHVIVSASAIDVPYNTLFGYHLARTAVSFVTPGPRVGGDAVAAGLLTRHKEGREKVKFSHGLSTLALDRAVEIQTFAVLFFLGVFWLSFYGTLPVAARIPLLLVSTSCLVFAVFVAVGFSRGKLVFTSLVKRFARKPRTVAAARRFEQETMAFYRTRPRAFWLATAVSVLVWLVSLLQYAAALRLLGIDTPLWGVFIVYCFIALAYLIPIPFALGSLETAQATAFAIIGQVPAGGIVLAILLRLRDVVLALIGFILLTSYGFTYKSAA